MSRQNRDKHTFFCPFSFFLSLTVLCRCSSRSDGAKIQAENAREKFRFIKQQKKPLKKGDRIAFLLDNALYSQFIYKKRNFII